MPVLKTLQKIDELAVKQEEIEKRELARREDLMLRLAKSKNNNLKLFSLKSKGE